MTAARTRTVAVIVIVVAFVALAAFALMARAYRPGRDGVNVPSNALALNTPQVAAPIAASTPISSALGGSGALTPLAPNAEAPTVTPAPAAPAPNATPPAALAPCEAGLAVPTEQAGLANLVALVPLFGPFAPEAFAMMPAFAPGFPLFGPLLIAGENGLARLQPALDVLVPAANALENAGYNALKPLYEPVRPQVLAGEAQLAETLAPGVAAFASAPGATCFPAALALIL